ncbi:tRNA (5-methylaminomethyl-2-thiouridine)(34)-methyltransferase MnmD [Membranicola marinus]|uniref:tRNA (5-methylaminomethyl-2-thiouridine)(34)-methyltransferase MnmD n=1 Tax=Membranihabitans marinus TaxID=1227546 RepID=A0A953HVB1_9BACT|nr:tRNA (5-methylaminomethyl-2-thiouridine)(34)-methyltransferase MnmD [Membranihabitans marinus]MBY5958930.1 tRNA (5-methylaminomethyl-2-thiouridine)(34)-methyltransferase MnmD [Membranihabitans marinus]
MEQSKYHRPTIQSTSDGSSTLNHSVLDELYHSRHGAWTESQHIFIQHGLVPVLQGSAQEISIFEMGFGSGLNAALVREAARRSKIPVHYVAVELYPVELDVIAEMAMPDQRADERNRWLDLHQSAWNEDVEIDPYFALHKIKGAFPDQSVPGSGTYDLIFYDAFAPGAQPELWGIEALGQCFDLLRRGGAWISYCSKGSVKRNLREVGFEVIPLPGPPGKREITKAVK